MKQTITLKCGNRGTRKCLETRTVEAEVVGSFGVHQSTDFPWETDPPWNVTHLKTGFLAVGGIRSQDAALKAAKDLECIGVNWDFSRPAFVKKFAPEALARIKAIKAEAQDA